MRSTEAGMMLHHDATVRQVEMKSPRRYERRGLDTLRQFPSPVSPKSQPRMIKTMRAVGKVGKRLQPNGDRRNGRASQSR
jgi:hypothetical protein